MAQQTLFDIPAPEPPEPPPTMMHLWDCGGTETGGGTIYRFRCSKCESVSDWLLLTDDELVKGVACREREATNA